MAESVGSVSVDILNGNVSPQSQAVETWAVAGVDGIGAQKMGEHKSGFVFVATLIQVQATLEARLVLLAAVQGTVVSIEDSFGEVWTNCLVTHVGRPERHAVIHEGTAKVRAVVTIAGQLTA